MLARIKPLLSWRFVKFSLVGASGLLVNLACLALLCEALSLQANLASALAIEVSINTNFLINELWTFRDRRSEQGGVPRRWLRFHLVSLVGATVQWLVFVFANMMWAALLGHGGESTGSFGDFAYDAVLNPPDVGRLVYVSQLFGIGAAMLWNFFANFYWTWKSEEGTKTL